MELDPSFEKFLRGQAYLVENSARRRRYFNRQDRKAAKVAENQARHQKNEERANAGLPIIHAHAPKRVARVNQRALLHAAL